MYVGPLLDGGLEAGHEVLWGPPRPSLHARDCDEDEDGYDKDNADIQNSKLGKVANTPPFSRLLLVEGGSAEI